MRAARIENVPHFSGAVRPAPIGLPPPPLFAPDEEWARWRERRRASLPKWSVDRYWLTWHALEQLPRVCAQVGTGKLIAFLERPQWWPHGAPILPPSCRKLHGLDRPSPEGIIAAILTKPDADTLLYIDRSSGEWDCPTFSRRGEDLIALCAWRWGVSDFKAAWRLARLLGLWRVVA